MLTALVVAAVLVVLLVAAVTATHEGDVLLDAPADAADVGLPELLVQPEDIAEVRFGMALRGYRMAEVDHVLDRLAQELAGRDAQIATLQGELASVPAAEEVAAPSWKQPMPHNPAPTVVSWSATPVEPAAAAPTEPVVDLVIVDEPEPEAEAAVTEPPIAAAPEPAAETPAQAEPEPSAVAAAPEAEPEPLAQAPAVAEPAYVEPPALPEPTNAFVDDDDFPEVLAPEDAPADLPEAHDPSTFPSAPPVEAQPPHAPPSGDGEISP